MIKKLLIFSFLVSVFTSLNAQIIESNDTSVCGNYSDTLQAIGATQDSISGDDDYSDLIQIGFPFTFYGNTYNSLVVCDNGYLTFDAYQANNSNSGYAIDPAGGGQGAIPYPFAGAFPNDNGPNNAIMAPFHDVCLNGCQTFITPGGSGSVYIAKTGVAPNRKFIATWCAAAMYSCYDSLNTFQIVLHEGSNKIETFIETKQSCSWDGGYAIHGLVGSTPTIGGNPNSDIVIDPVLGQPRNFPLLWTASQEGWEFIPNGTTSYTINQIPFSTIFAGLANWTDINGVSLGVGANLPVNLSTSTVIYATVNGTCSGLNLIDSVVIDISSCFGVILSSVEASCLGNDASIFCSPDTILPSWDVELQGLDGIPIQYIPNITASSYTFSNLFAGTYIVKLTDHLGSTSQDTIVVSQAQNPFIINSYPYAVSCYGGNNGYIGVWAYGGVFPYTFYIDGVLNTNAYPLDSSFLNLSAGNYIISVYDADSLCMIRDTVEVTAPSYPLQALAASKVIVCNGQSAGELSGSAAGGTPGYSYEWFDSGFTSFSTNDTAFDLSAGSYTLRVEDANGCDTFTSVTVIEPQIPLQGSPQVFNVACKGGSTGMIVGDASGGWAPYTYEWFDSNNNPLRNTVNIFTRDTLESLEAGIYILHIYDSQGCFKDYTFTIDEPDYSLSIDSLAVIVDIACFGDSVGSARLYVSGGVPNYSYLWDNGETSIIADELTAGLHTVSLTDYWGCTVDSSIEISENPLIESDLVVDATVSCYGGSDGIASISTSAGGASPTYTYFWSQGQTTSFVNNDIAVGLSHGSYYVTTRDALGCEVFDTIYISQPEILIMEASELDWIDCYGYNNGEAFAVAQGGTEPYVFSWDVGTWIGDTISTLQPGLHTVVVMDAKGCTANDTILTHEPTELTITIDPSQTILPYCIGVNTGSLTAAASGGNLGYTYAWNDNSVQPQTTTTATALLAGNQNSPNNFYTITVTDSKGCTASDSANIDTITNTMENLTEQVISLSGLQYVGSHDISCYGFNDGSASVTALGGHAPYSYQWVGLNGFSSTNDTITDLLAGVYSITITDTNNCTVNRSIYLTEPAPIYFTVDPSAFTEETCLGSCDGIILIDSVSGGVMPYTGLVTENTTSITNALLVENSTIDSICSGIYSVNIMDANQCPSVLIAGGNDQVNIIALDVITTQIETSYTSPLCAGDSTVQINMTLASFDSLYTYSWINTADPGAILGVGDSIDSIPSGTYVLHASYLGCQASDTIVVIAPDLIQISAAITNVTCYGDNNGSIDVSIVGGTLGASNAYNLLWSTNDTIEDISNLSPGSYILSATDILGCEESVTFQVTEPQVLSCSVTQNGYVLTANPNGGTAPYSYSWREIDSPGNEIGTGTTYTVDDYGTYYAIVKDDNNCTFETDTSAYIEVIIPPTSIDDSFSGIDLSIYLNPFREETTVDFGTDIKQATIRVVDVFGKHIEEYNITNTNKHIITRNNKANGIYFVEIQFGEVRFFRKIIME